jgi:hypothetical protein
VRSSQNTVMLELVAKSLKDLKDELVFVGGVTIDLYITDQAQPGIRATVDVDCVIKVATRAEYQEIEKRLYGLGFKNDINGPICRYIKGSLILDLMPTEKKILGFSNIWYPEGIENKISIKLDNGTKIFIFSTPYFLASKLEAFKHRGKGDYRLSHDIEDFVAVIDGNEEIINDIKKAPNTVREYIKKIFKSLLNNQDFTDSLLGHVSDRSNIEGRIGVITERMQAAVK